MAHFLIDFRLHGYAREYAKWARERTIRAARKIGIRRLREPRFVPHITLFGPAETHDLRNVIREAERVCQKYTLVPFTLGIRRGEFQQENANWLYLDIHPSPQLEQLRYELAQSLIRLEKGIHNTCRHYDRGQEYKFHCSIGSYDPTDSAKFEKLAEYAETKCSLEAFKQSRASILGRLLNILEKYIFKVEERDPGISQHLVRVTVLGKGSRIQAEYDLVLGRRLTRREALSRYWWRKTIEELMELRSSPEEKHLSVAAESVYFIGDTHFDHKNIIRYTHRPFSSVAQMNRVMEKNWNSTVGDNSTVYFLGDWSFGRRARPAFHWKSRLKGKIISIEGSHDRHGGDIRSCDFEELHVAGHDFLLIHNPNANDKHQTPDQKEKLENWHGWIIHGHVHNNQMDRYPFVNGERRTINVSVELTNYKPVSLEYLLSLDLDSIKRMRTIDSQPERW